MIDDAEALIFEQVSREIIQGTVENSIILRMGRKLLNMISNKTKMSEVERDLGFKQTPEMAQGNKYINAEKLAVITTILEAVLDDADYDIWERRMLRWQLLLFLKI